MSAKKRPVPEQDPETGRFIAGNSGNGGRPKGSRDKLGQAFIQAAYEDFLEHGPDSIVKMRENNPADYVRVIAGLLPKELNIKQDFADLSDDELDRVIAGLADHLGIGSEAGAHRGGAEQEAPNGAKPAQGVPTLQ